MLTDIASVMYTEEEVQNRVAELAAQIRKDYDGKKLLLTAVLKGGFIFAADLYRKLNMPAEVDFIAVSSYGQSSATSGVVRINKDLDRDVSQKHILIVEDIIDSGLTLSYLVNLLESRRPESVQTCAFLDKPSRRIADITPRYTGFEIPDEFVVGFGLDYCEKYRNLPFIGILKREVYE